MKTNVLQLPTAKMLKINKKLQNLLRPLNEIERSELEKSIKRDGVLDAIKYWRNPENDCFEIIDGHNRKEIADRLGINYEMVEIKFTVAPIIESVMYWMYRNQSARRDGQINAVGMKQCLQAIADYKQAPISDYKAVQTIASDTGISPNTIKSQIQREKPSKSLKTPLERILQMIAKLSEEDREALRQAIEKPGDQTELRW